MSFRKPMSNEEMKKRKEYAPILEAIRGGVDTYTLRSKTGISGTVLNNRLLRLKQRGIITGEKKGRCFFWELVTEKTFKLGDKVTGPIGRHWYTPGFRPLNRDPDQHRRLCEGIR